MKNNLYVLLAAFSLFSASCKGAGENNVENSDTAGSTAAMAETGEAPGGSTNSTTATNSRFITRDEAQEMINNYNSNPLANVSTKFYLVDAAQLKAYLDYAVDNDIKDVQVLFARNDGQLTLVISGLRADGTHVLYPDPNNNNTPSALEHCLPCPPGTDCYGSTNLSQ